MLTIAGFASGIALVVLSWRARRLARTIDRWEVAGLKSLVVLYLTFTVAFAVERRWLSAVSCAVGLFLNNANGSSLHPNQSNRQLAQGTIQRMEEGDRAELSNEESFTVAKSVAKAAFVLGSVLAVVSLSLGLKWYVGFPASWAVACISVGALAVLAVYKRSPK
jgi:Kef-type K+ transport system membrane component KefB